MQEAISRWSETAPYWEKHRAVIREMFAPITQALIEAAHIRRGSAVLDIATGPGEPALAIAEFVGNEGKVLGIDPVPEMVEAARREANRQGLRNATFAVAQAATALDAAFSSRYRRSKHAPRKTASGETHAAGAPRGRDPRS